MTSKGGDTMGFFHWLHKDIYREICRLEKMIMATKAELQAKLDDYADRNEAAVTNIKAAIDDLKQQVANTPNVELDFSRLDASVSDAEGADGVPGTDGPEAFPPVANPVV